MMTEIANERARGQLKETHNIKLNLGTCRPIQCAREKNLSKLKKKPIDKLASALSVTQTNAYKIKQKQYYNYMCKKGNTK